MGKIAEDARNLITTRRAIDNHVAVLAYEQIEEPRQCGGGERRSGNLSHSCQQMQAAFGNGYESLEQSRVESVKVLQCVTQAKGGPHVQVDGGVSESSKINQNGRAVALLQGERRIDGH